MESRPHVETTWATPVRFTINAARVVTRLPPLHYNGNCSTRRAESFRCTLREPLEHFRPFERREEAHVRNAHLEAAHGGHRAPGTGGERAQAVRADGHVPVQHAVGELAQGVARVLEHGPKLVPISRVALVEVAGGPVFVAEQGVMRRPTGLECAVERRELL